MEEDLLTALPPELLSRIFSYIPGETLVGYLFVCRAFYNTIVFPGSISCIDISFINDCFDVDKKGLRENRKFYLNVLSNRRRTRIRAVEVVDRYVSAGNFAWLMENYKVRDVCFPRHVGSLSNPIDFNQFLKVGCGLLGCVHKFRFGFGSGISLDLNVIGRLVDEAPNLEVLEIDEVHSISSKVYSGKILSRLKMLTIVARQGSDNSTVDVLSSFFLNTPNLEGLVLKGNVLERKVREFLDIIKQLDLASLCFEIPFSSPVGCLPEGSRLKELSLICYKHLRSCRCYNLNSVESFCIKGDMNGLDFCSTSLKQLIIDGKGRLLLDESRLTKICEQCPDLEELGVRFWTPPLDWVVLISLKKCPRLRTIRFKGFEKGYDIKWLNGVGIRNIYVEERFKKSDKNWLVRNGFDITYVDLLPN